MTGYTKAGNQMYLLKFSIVTVSCLIPLVGNKGEIPANKTYAEQKRQSGAPQLNRTTYTLNKTIDNKE